MTARTYLVSLVALSLSIAASQAQILDAFSGDWTRFASTPGEISVETGRLRLTDGPESPDWIVASRTFRVNLDKTPFFLVRVAAVSERGTVKLIRQKPYDKRVALEIDRPGLYALDIRGRFGWQGTTDIETCLYALGDRAEITYEYVKFSERLTQREAAQIAERTSGGNAKLHVAPFEIVPLFNTSSFYLKGPELKGVAAVYRQESGPWQRAYPPVYVQEDGMYRGSIVDLEEDTPYELKIMAANGDLLAQQGFRTWRSDVPIARTVVLDETTFSGQLTVRESGDPNGWIKITSREGFVLRNDRTGPLIELDGVKHVLLEGLTLRGGLKEAITIKRCQHIRVVNCDIAGWGRIGTQRFDLDGKYYTDEGSAINWDSAILISKSIGTVVERCYVHDPVNRANSWYYSHPSGPQAVGMDKSPSTVLRYNDFIGSDRHRWNDAVEGAGNYHIDGGFHRDGDVYGNMICFANDDAVEIDGGQTNVRVFLNRFEGCLCGVSIQGCMSGPSYVFRNLLVNMGDDTGLAGQTIKTSSHANGPGAVSFIFNNTCYGTASDLSLRHNLRIVAKNNIFAGRSAIIGRDKSPQSECDYNLLSTGQAGDEPHGILARPAFMNVDAGLFAPRQASDAVGRGVALDNFASGARGRPDMGAIPFGSDLDLPWRPIPVTLDRHQLMFSALDLKSGRTKTISASVRGGAFKSPYRIAQNEAFDWFEVTPKGGILAASDRVTFGVTLRAERMTERRLYRGAFLVRLASGFSRPVMVYARTDVVPPVKPRREDVWVTYLEAEAIEGDPTYAVLADAGASGGNYLSLSGPARIAPIEYRFDVPKAGKYFVLLRNKSVDPIGSRRSLYFAVDEETLDRSQLRSAPSWTWSMAAHNSKMSLICLQAFDLTAGEHHLRLAPRDPLDIDLLAITDSPGMFD